MRMPTFLLSLIMANPAPADPIVDAPHPPEGHLLRVPKQLLNRCTSDRRLTKINAYGGNPATEQAVIDALRFLKNTQSENGSWTTERPVAMTGIALLCFLGHGDTTKSAEFGNTILKSVQFLVSTAVKNRGKMASDFRNRHWSYEHAISTYALAEAYSLCKVGFGEKIPNLKRAVEVSGQIVIDSQHQGGGWDYHYSEDSARGGDVSQTSWQLLALKACKGTGLEFRNLTKCWIKGLDYIEGCQLASGAMGYTSPHIHDNQDGTTMAALGACCFQIWKSPATKVAQKAVRFIDEEMKFGWNTPNCDLYAHLFASRAMFNNGGPQWQRYHQLVFPQILENQAPGGFFLAPNHGDKKAIKAINASFALPSPYGVHYRTCFATLILQTYYRYPVPLIR